MNKVSSIALALYLFLLTVADEKGLSYYSDKTVSKILSLEAVALSRARQELIAAALIAFQAPLYQVLSLDPPRTGDNGPEPIGDLLRCLPEKKA